MQLCMKRTHASWRFIWVLSGITLLFAAPYRIPGAWAQVAPEAIGRLSGDDVTVTGALGYEVEGGWSTAILANGNEVTVRSGKARIELVEGGEIAICGPARFSVLKSGSAITLALDYGLVHPIVAAAVPLTVYTPLVVATPMTIDQGSNDLTVGLSEDGAFCARPARGAVRIEQQLSGQSLLVPQGGTVNFAGGQLIVPATAEGSCTCDLLATRRTAPRQLELSVPVRPAASRPSPPVIPPPVLTEEPVYKVYMPPLTFDSSSPLPPPEPDAETILLVREARLRPTVVFRGQVKPAAAVPVASSPGAATGADDRPTAERPNIFARFINIFRRSKMGAPCVGAGCG